MLHGTNAWFQTCESAGRKVSNRSGVEPINVCLRRLGRQLTNQSLVGVIFLGTYLAT